MKLLTIAMLAGVLCIPATAVTITFDSSIPAGVTIQYFDGGLTGPLAALPVPNAIPLASTQSAIDLSSALQTYDTLEGFGPYGVLFSFDYPMFAVSMVGNDFGGDPDLDNEVVHLTAFDTAGAVIGTSSVSLPYEMYGVSPISVSGTGIRHVAFTWTNDLGYYSVDNVVVSGIPEPGSIILFASGAAVLVRFRSRRA